MADPVGYVKPERDFEQALVTLKKGTQLIKYSRKGKPKFRAFRLAPDETTLIWLSHGEEKTLKLASVSRITPGQRTAVFRRYLRPEKDYLSFSLIYNNGERSLDLICKDKSETEVWFSGLKVLIGQNHNRRAKSEISELNDGDCTSNNRLSGASLDHTNSIPRGRTSVDFGFHNSPLSIASSDVGSERGNMQLRTSTDGFRISVSSTPSCSSGGSGQDDIESLGDVYVWGEVWSDGMLADGSLSSIPVKIDMLVPKPLESNVVLDVHQIACGIRHMALVTRQGEVFTWGEESGGRLGHGVEKDVTRPHLVEFLALINVEFVACGEHHTCAVSTSGDLFTWGDGIHNAGLLGQGNDVSHWIPKRVCGYLEGLQVLSIACGTWHSALATSNGKLFTFGDGTYGVLGHGDRENVLYPKEVQQLGGLKTVKVACGLWHTAAIVEVMGHSGNNISSRKLFTWGDGDKHRLGHGNKETYLLPTCVSALIDYNFFQLACGHSMTVALTTSGHVFTMGGTVHGQLGNTLSDGKLPVLVQDRLVGEFVEEIACGAYHVAVLTSRSEVFTWGKGSNGRLGHGDTEDRRTPSLVEALKDRHVKNISCGSNFTSSICIHKWVSGADQSVCSGCRQAFGFTRKRHNCYNCGLVHCHGCSSKKALKAALAPTPGKPHRVCDSCYTKLKAAEAGVASNVNRSVTVPICSVDGMPIKPDREVRPSRPLLSSTTEPIKYLDVKPIKPGAKPESPSIVRASQVTSFKQLKDIAFPSSLSALQSAFKPVPTPPSTPGPATPAQPSRPSSPYARRPSPPRTSGFSRSVIDSLKKTNDVLHQEIAKLQKQMKILKYRCDTQDAEIDRLQKTAKDTVALADEESSKHRAATEVLKSITEQLKDFTEKLPPEVSESEALKSINDQVKAYLNADEISKPPSLRMNLDFDQQSTQDTNLSINSSSPREPRTLEHTDSIGSSTTSQDARSKEGTATSHHSDSRSSEASTSAVGKTEIIEQFEPGVYITFVQGDNGDKIFSRVRFSKRRFDEHQAAEWWSKNKDSVQKKYRPPGSAPHHYLPSSTPQTPDMLAPSAPTSNPPPPDPSNETEPPL